MADYLLTGIAPHLAEAYAATCFLVDTPKGPLRLRAGERTRELEQLLLTYETDCWAFITAHNPGAIYHLGEEGHDGLVTTVPLSPHVNERRHSQLIARVGELIFDWLPGRGIPDAGDWPAEESLFIPRIGLGSALQLGRRFGQNAILAGVAGGPPTLVSCRLRDWEECATWFSCGRCVLEAGTTQSPETEHDQVQEWTGYASDEEEDEYQASRLPPLLGEMSKRLKQRIIALGIPHSYSKPDPNPTMTVVFGRRPGTSQKKPDMPPG